MVVSYTGTLLSVEKDKPSSGQTTLHLSLQTPALGAATLIVSGDQSSLKPGGIINIHVYDPPAGPGAPGK